MKHHIPEVGCWGRMKRFPVANSFLTLQMFQGVGRVTSYVSEAPHSFSFVGPIPAQPSKACVYFSVFSHSPWPENKLDSLGSWLCLNRQVLQDSSCGPSVSTGRATRALDSLPFCLRTLDSQLPQCVDWCSVLQKR